MPHYRRRTERIEGHREAASVAATLGRELRSERRRLGLTTAEVAARVDLSRSWVSEIERGGGAGTTLESWIALGLAVGRPLAVALSRSLRADPADAGHLELQEVVIRLARAAGLTATVELPTRPVDPRFSVDVCVRDDRHRALVLYECWNRFGDLGAALRSSNRKAREAADLAAAIGGDAGPYTVHLCWILRPTAANRDLVRRFPDLLASRFPGSSVGWGQTLETVSAPPVGAGLVWLDARVGRPVPLRLRRRRG